MERKELDMIHGNILVTDWGSSLQIRENRTPNIPPPTSVYIPDELDDSGYSSLPRLNDRSLASMQMRTGSPSVRPLDPRNYQLVAPAMSQNDKLQLLNALNSHRYNTVTDLRRVERVLAYLNDAEVTEPMTRAWRYYVDSHNFLSELRGLTRNYLFSSECLDEAKILVQQDPASIRSWNYCWLILVKIQRERLIQKHARNMAVRSAMWGNQTPPQNHVEMLYNNLVAEWTRAVKQMLKLWDQPPGPPITTPTAAAGELATTGAATATAASQPATAGTEPATAGTESTETLRFIPRNF